MVPAVRSGPPTIPPPQTGRATDTARFQDFARSMLRAEGGPAPGKTPAPSPTQRATSTTATSTTASRAEPESDPSRPVRTPRPGSLVDVRV